VIDVRALLRAAPAPAAFLGTGAIITSVFSGWTSEMGIPFPPSRVLFIAMIGVVLVDRLRSSTEPPLRIGPVHVLMILTVVYVTVSSAAARTLGETEHLYGVIDKVGLAPFVMFALAPVVFDRKEDRNVLLVGLVGTGGYLSLVAFLESAGAEHLVIPSYIADERLGMHAERSRGPFLEATANGLALFGCAAASWIASRVWTSRRARRSAVAVCVACCIATVTTMTRSIWIGTFLGLTVLVIGDAQTRRVVMRAAPIGAIGIVVALTALPNFDDDASRRLGDERPVWDRINSNAAAARAWREAPALGVGWGRFPSAHETAFVQADTIPLTGNRIAIHNLFLSHATELGLVGGGLWLVTLAAGVGAALVRRSVSDLVVWRLGLGAFAIHWFVVANLTPAAVPFAHLLLWTLAGIVGISRARGAT
jgi:putative inorganic carbon (hco3(-)) transporter